MIEETIPAEQKATKPNGKEEHKMINPTIFFATSNRKNKSVRPATSKMLRFKACTGNHIEEKHIIWRRMIHASHFAVTNVITRGRASAANNMANGKTIKDVTLIIFR